MSLAAGVRLGPYEVVGSIGAGGMGEVYRAKDTRLWRDVAVKVLPPSFADDPDRLRRFEQEARAAGMLNHPNILAVYDIGTPRRRSLRRLRAARRRDAARADRRDAAAAAQGDRLRDSRSHAALRRARQGHRPSRPQAREHLHHTRRPREDPRLRPGQAGASRWLPPKPRSSPGHAVTEPRPAWSSAPRPTCRRSRSARIRSISAPTSSPSASSSTRCSPGSRRSRPTPRSRR